MVGWLRAPVSRQSDPYSRETDSLIMDPPASTSSGSPPQLPSAASGGGVIARAPGEAPTPDFLARVDAHPMPVSSSPVDYAAGVLIPSHMHAKHQLMHAVHGVMVVATPGGRWVVPPTRGLWMPARTPHEIRAVGELHMRSTYVHPQAAPGLPEQPRAVGISPLLRELILAAAQIDGSYAADSREGRLTRLLIDELRLLPTLPLHLPEPADARLRRICAALQAQPDDRGTLADWAATLGVDARTLQRMFARETGMTFGRWRQQARLLGALEQLAGGARVLDVALAFGYDSPSAFAARFKRQFGQPPSTFFA